MKYHVSLFFISILFLLISCSDNKEKENFDFLDTNLPIDQRVDILVSQLTLQEKVSQLVYESKAIDRLDIPEYNWWNECLHGVARAGYATVFPQSITIAASWDDSLVYQVATTISDEARAKHHEFLRKGKRGIYQGLTFWSPNINIFRDPRWGRGHETYGEDPYLTGDLGASFVEGLQGNDPKYLKVVATAKHYAVHSGPEPLRHKFNAEVSERDLRETYLPAFRTLVEEAKVYSVMGAYNQFEGKPCCASPMLLDSILRGEWGFKGYVVSDCGAIADFYIHQHYSDDAAAAAAEGVKIGTDLNCGGTYNSLTEAVERGLLTEDEIDVAVKRLFTARFKLGMFDPEEEVAYAQIPFSENASAKNDKLALEAAQKSIVLLKNANHTLPLSKDIKTLAVIGPNADNWESLVGNYNGIAKNPITVLKGLKAKLKDTKILYAPGSNLADGIDNLTVIPSKYFVTDAGEQGIKGEYFNNDSLGGEPMFTRIDKNIDFYWESKAPSDKMDDDNFSVRWSGYMVPPVSGKYKIGCWGMPDLKVIFEGDTILKHRSEHHGFYHEKAVEMEAGKKYKVVYDYRNWHGDGDAKLVWSMPNENMQEKAVALANKADAVVLVLGLSQRLEGEEMPVKVDGFDGGDRTKLLLPESQRKLMKAVKATGKPVILVLLNGSALAINWADKNIDAILSAGYPGQEGGTAVANVLLGDYNPAGRLPVTYYKSVNQLPDFENYDMTGRTYKYFEGEPLYPFGYGLSYTTFKYSDIKVPGKSKIGDKVSVSVNVSNTGKIDGEEVIELYLKDVIATTPRPKYQLEGFKRIYLKAGETKTVKFELLARQFSMIGKDDKRVIEPGNFKIFIGGSLPEGRGANYVSAGVELLGDVTEIK